MPESQLPEDTPGLKKIVEHGHVAVGKKPGHNEPPQSDELFVGTEHPRMLRVDVKPPRNG
jgi:hypothetical protein